MASMVEAKEVYPQYLANAEKYANAHGLRWEHVVKMALIGGHEFYDFLMSHDAADLAHYVWMVSFWYDSDGNPKPGVLDD